MRFPKHTRVTVDSLWRTRAEGPGRQIRATEVSGGRDPRRSPHPTPRIYLQMNLFVDGAICRRICLCSSQILHNRWETDRVLLNPRINSLCPAELARFRSGSKLAPQALSKAGLCPGSPAGAGGGRAPGAPPAPAQDRHTLG